MLKDAMLPAY